MVATEEQSRSPKRCGGSTTGSGRCCSPTRSTASPRRLARGGVGTTSGAVAAQLKRARARLRVEYLLALEQVEPPTDRCRAVLLALSGADRRRQREVDAAQHLLECELCARLSEPLLGRGPVRDDEVQVPDQRRRGHRRRPAGRPRGGGARRVHRHRPDPARDGRVGGGPQHRAVRRTGEVTVELLEGPAGPASASSPATPARASPTSTRRLSDGYSTYDGLGLGLPGARRLMDEFDIVSETGRGTTVTMTKWRQEGDEDERPRRHG